MKFSPVAMLAAVAVGVAGGIYLNQNNIGFPASWRNATVSSVAAPAGQIETIFLALDTTRMPIPVDRIGSGGAMTTIGDSLLLMTHEGRFFDVSGDAGTRLDITAPDDGWDAMLDFESDNPEYEFAHFYFRYNDVEFGDDHLMVSFTKWEAEEACYRTVMARAPLGGVTDPSQLSIAESDWDIFFETQPCLEPKQKPGRAVDGHMAGGRFRIAPNGDVILASGDYAFDGTYSETVLSQDPSNNYGKVLRITPDTGDVTTISEGHSNMQGVAFHESGDLFIVEHGRRGGDEINLIREGLNYGWPEVSLGTRYNKLPLRGTLSDYGRHTGYEEPRFSWLPSVAVSSLAALDGFHPSWDGDLVAGSLSGRALFRIRISDGRVLFNERIPIGERVRYVAQHGDDIALWTDSKEVIKLSVGEFDASAQFAHAKINDLDLSSDQKESMKVVLDQCAECHNFGVIASEAAPALGPVFGEAIASGDYRYSDALRSMDGTWTRDALTAYLTDPAGFAPGTSMPNPQISDPEIITGLVDILEALQLQPE